MNIVYHLRVFPKLSETFILNEIYALLDSGHQVAVFAFNDPGDEIVHTEYESLDIPIRYADPLTVGTAWNVFHPALSQSGVVSALPHDLRMAHRDLFFARQLLRFIDELPFHPDVIHGHFASGMRTSAQLVSNALGIAHVITVHANDIFLHSNRATARRVLTAADRVITVCESNRQFLESELQIDTPVDIVPASIRFETFTPSASFVDGRVLSIARLTEKKGLRYAIDAVEAVQTAIPELSYHIIGSGALRSELEERICAAGIEDTVTVLGSVPDDRLREELDAAQVFLLPCLVTDDGDRDATPVVLKEAMAMGTPCISTSISGIPEIIDDGENGVLVPPEDVTALSTALTSLLCEGQDERIQYERMARNAREKAAEFDVHVTVHALEASFEKSIANTY